MSTNSKSKRARTEPAKPRSVQRVVGHPIECERRYYTNREWIPGDYDTATFRQNMEVPGGDHWLIELNLDRWRNAEELAGYLRWAAESIEILSGRMPNSVLDQPSADK